MGGADAVDLAGAARTAEEAHKLMQERLGSGAHHLKTISSGDALESKDESFVFYYVNELDVP